MVVKKKAASRVKSGAKKAVRAVKKTVKKAAKAVKKTVKAVKKASPVKKAKSAVKKVAKAKPVKAAKAPKKKAAKTKRKSSGGLSKMTYTLSEELQAVVGAKSLTRPEIVKKLWAYIKSHHCQDTKNRRMINPDAKLAEVIGKKPVDMMKLAGLLSKHIK